MALIHFNMATFVRDGDPGCNQDNWNVHLNCSNVQLFNPARLNTTQWAEVFKALGAKHSVLTAKHGSGFCIWNTNATLPDGSPYRYAVMRDGGFPRDVVAEYVAAMESANIGYGFYYSTGNNFYLNRINFKPAGALLPDQGSVTDEEYLDIVVAQLTELWSQFGNLTEIWFDHGYGDQLKPRIQALLQEKQPDAVGFGGYGLMPSPVRWVGTESGTPPYPIWSTGKTNDGGDPDSGVWAPAGVDTTLQWFDHWFFQPGTPIRSLATLIDVYHKSVGQNGVLELDFAINRDGLVEPEHEKRYRELGAWIEACYGNAVASTSDVSGSVVELDLSAPVSVDRVIIQEDQRYGQRVRAYTVSYKAAGSDTWTPWLSGTSVGNKRIHLAPRAVIADAVQLTITAQADAPRILRFALFKPC